MPMNQARVLFDAVMRKQFFQARHPDVKIALHYSPAWHWTGQWTGPDGTRREIADHDLAFLLDELEALMPPPQGEEAVQ
jgi:hypothetical protein